MAELADAVIRVYGPYTRKDGRQHVILYDGVTRQTISYPKYLVQQSLGRKLADNETVDHNDRDKSNDALTNLVIRDRVEHAKLDARRVTILPVKCSWCRRVFTPSKDQGRKRGIFCCKSCAGAYGAEIQNGRMKKARKVKLQKVAFTLKD